MSNIIAGDIFERIIDEVVKASQTDFEENGVSQQTLIELKQTWHQKLSTRQVAQMPWDPKPAPPAPPAQSAAASSHASTGDGYSNGSQSQNANGSHVKAESAEAGYQPMYVPPPINPELAQQRAASLLQQQYGSQASASLGAMQQRGIALPGQQATAGQQKGPGAPQLTTQNPQALQQQYAQQLKQQQAAQQPRIKTEANAEPGEVQDAKRQRLAYAQTDGADDWASVVSRARDATEPQLIRNDAIIRSHITTGKLQLESGLLQPVGSRSARGTKHRNGPKSAPDGIPQLDGDFFDEAKAEEDENAINSDLDSSGDEANNPDDDDDEMDSMLCTYDKVQRVKNKWKCTLKDGVLSANGKEYLFHKAQGEFEW